MGRMICVCACVCADHQAASSGNGWTTFQEGSGSGGQQNGARQSDHGGSGLRKIVNGIVQTGWTAFIERDGYDLASPSSSIMKSPDPGPMLIWNLLDTPPSIELDFRPDKRWTRLESPQGVSQLSPISGLAVAPYSMGRLLGVPPGLPGLRKSDPGRRRSRPTRSYPPVYI